MTRGLHWLAIRALVIALSGFAFSATARSPEPSQGMASTDVSRRCAGAPGRVPDLLEMC
jgi:hypothetical protein